MAQKSAELAQFHGRNDDTPANCFEIARSAEFGVFRWLGSRCMQPSDQRELTATAAVHRPNRPRSAKEPDPTGDGDNGRPTPAARNSQRSPRAFSGGRPSCGIQSMVRLPDHALDQPAARRVQREVREDAVRPGTLEAEQRFEHTGLVEPAVLRGSGLSIAYSPLT